MASGCTTVCVLLHLFSHYPQLCEPFFHNHNAKMRLLNCKTGKLYEFSGSMPRYAILSHTWRDEEVTFDDIRRGAKVWRGLGKKKAAFAKIRGFCRQADRAGLEWGWVDTCCIDKSSSAELSEAINSMYQWYQDAAVCYVYLQDLNAPKPRFTDLGDPLDPGSPVEHEQTSLAEYRNRFRHCRWFSRGWTLQELIAPRHVEFYASDWTELGTKLSLERLLHEVTGISTKVLRGYNPLLCSVGERMGWAAHRRTSRLEDTAYCLLGIFQVNMPLIYGEGAMAFRRLQEMILQRCEDYSLLAWSSAMRSNYTRPSVLAVSPRDFGSLRIHGPECLIWDDLSRHLEDCPGRDSGSIGTWASDELRSSWIPTDTMAMQLDPPSFTSRGLRATLLVRPTSDPNILLAFIFGYCGEQPLCVLLSTSTPFDASSSTTLGPVAAYRGANTLIAVEPALLQDFIKITLHLSADDIPVPRLPTYNIRPSSHMAVGISGGKHRVLRLRAVSPDYLNFEFNSELGLYVLENLPTKKALLLFSVASAPSRFTISGGASHTILLILLLEYAHHLRRFYCRSCICEHPAQGDLPVDWADRLGAPLLEESDRVTDRIMQRLPDGATVHIVLRTEQVETFGGGQVYGPALEMDLAPPASEAPRGSRVWPSLWRRGKREPSSRDVH